MRGLALTTGLAIGALVIAVLAAEALLRLLQLAPSGGVFTVDAREFDELPGLFSPNQTVKNLSKPQLPHRVQINSLGYRGEDFQREKAATEFRILYVGDSFTFGDFVDDSQTLPAQLERRLVSNCKNVTVVNAGLGGSTITEQEPIVRRGLAIGPDMVILMFSENDVTDLSGTSMWEELAANRKAKSKFPISLLYKAARNTALWNLALKARGAQRARQLEPASADRTSPDDTLQSQDDLREAYIAKLNRLTDTLSRYGVDFILTAFPSHLTVYQEWDSDQLGWLENAASTNAIRYINLLDTLRSAGQDKTALYLLPIDGHASALGYSIAAGKLAQDLLKSLNIDCKR